MKRKEIRNFLGRTIAMFISLGIILPNLTLSYTHNQVIASEDKVPTIRWLTTGDGAATPLKQGDRIVDEINKRLGINLQVDVVAEGNMDKVNLAMASSDLPDIVTGAFAKTATQRWIDSGMLVDLSQYFDQCSNLKNKLENEFSWTSTDGKYYGMPFIVQYDVANRLIIMRKDWLDKLGLKYPTTLDKMKEVLIAFTTQDPDGNGRDDTYGYSDLKPSGDFSWCVDAFGNEYGDYTLVDGQVMPYFESEAYKDGMSFARELWKSGCIDPEFMLNDTKMLEEKFYQGKIGAFIAPLFRHVSRIEGNLKQLFPDGEIAYGLPPKGPNGDFGLSRQGKSGFYTAVTIKSDAPEKAAKFIDFMISDEGSELLRLGIEGVHYTKENGKIIYNEEERAKDSFAANGWAHALAWGSFSWPLESSYLPETEPMRDRALDSVKLATEAQKKNLIPKMLPAAVEYGSALDDLVTQAQMEMLTGDSPIEEIIKKLGEDWRLEGGDEVLSEAQEAYEETK